MTRAGMVMPARPVVIGPRLVADRPDLHLDTVQLGWHGDDERPHIPADVEQDRSLTRVRVLPPVGDSHHAAALPGMDW